MQDKRTEIAIIGCGGMGGALVLGLWQSDQAGRYSYRICDQNLEGLANLASQAPAGLQIQQSEDAKVAVRGAEIVLLVVKPQHILPLAKTLATEVSREALIVSSAAGIALADIEGEMGKGRKLARVMPNTGARVAASTTGIFMSKNCENPRDFKRIGDVFNAVGEVVFVASEEDLHTVTAVAGSGPAFVLLVLEAMMAGAQAEGMDPEKARLFAIGAHDAAIALMKARSSTPEALRKEITSPGGTTRAGLDVLENEGAARLVEKAIHAAAKRSRELGRG
jgi:pyrroline-5-carboxylate reductase